MQCNTAPRRSRPAVWRIAAFTIAIFWPYRALADAELNIASPPLQYYAPLPTFHDRTYRRLGVMVSYVVGPEYTQAVIVDSRRHEWQLIVSGSFTMEGRRLRCEQAPDRGDVAPDVFCPDWPSDIDVYSTPVIFTYWITRLGSDEIAVLQSVEVAPTGRFR